MVVTITLNKYNVEKEDMFKCTTLSGDTVPRDLYYISTIYGN